MTQFIKTKVDYRDVSRMLDSIPNIIDGISERAVKRNLNRAYRVAVYRAPVERGDTVRGILLPKIEQKARGTVGSISWSETNSRREASFKRGRGKKWGDFLTWMHESPYSRKEFPWKSGEPDFMYQAQKNSEEHLLDDFRIELKKNAKKSRL